jgi:hypothetical protein
MTTSAPETDQADAALAGPIMQSGEMAELVVQAVAEDNPGVEVYLSDEGSYIHTRGRCRLTAAPSPSWRDARSASGTWNRRWRYPPATSSPRPTRSSGTRSRVRRVPP